jgi:hypothetical protein
VTKSLLTHETKRVKMQVEKLTWHANNKKPKIFLAGSLEFGCGQQISASGNAAEKMRIHWPNVQYWPHDVDRDRCVVAILALSPQNQQRLIQRGRAVESTPGFK